MVNTAHSLNTSTALVALVMIGCVLTPFGSPAVAQSRAAFATMPYTKSETPNTILQLPLQSQRVVQEPKVVAPVRYSGPAPIVMFRGTPQPPPQIVPLIAPVIADRDIPTADGQYSTSNQAERDVAKIGWDRANLDPVIAPPIVSDGTTNIEPLLEDTNGGLSRRYRTPLRRILEDTAKGLTRDLPDAVANALPWVDRDAKNEPFDDVLDRVADELHRASQTDPAWALPVQHQIRALSRRLDALPVPPPDPQLVGTTQIAEELVELTARPFRPRPIWPGASGRPEAQIRPVTLTTSSGQQDGPRATGITARYEPTAEDDDGKPPPQAAPRAPIDGGRSPPPRRRAKSR